MKDIKKYLSDSSLKLLNKEIEDIEKKLRKADGEFININLINPNYIYWFNSHFLKGLSFFNTVGMNLWNVRNNILPSNLNEMKGDKRTSLKNSFKNAIDVNLSKSLINKKILFKNVMNENEVRMCKVTPLLNIKEENISNAEVIEIETIQDVEGEVLENGEVTIVKENVVEEVVITKTLIENQIDLKEEGIFLKKDLRYSSHSSNDYVELKNTYDIFVYIPFNKTTLLKKLEENSIELEDSQVDTLVKMLDGFNILNMPIFLFNKNQVNTLHDRFQEGIISEIVSINEGGIEVIFALTEIPKKAYIDTKVIIYIK